jgi:hypothetical protein
MHIIQDRIESARPSGHRTPGHFYLVGKIAEFYCCQLPIPLPVDMMPKAGIVPVPEAFIRSRLKACRKNDCPGSRTRVNPFEENSLNTAGMVWVPESYYPSAAIYVQEARQRGYQVHIKSPHCGIKPGQSWVLLAHRKAIVDYARGMGGWVDEEGEAHTEVGYKPGIFGMFKVDAIEYVIPRVYQDGEKTYTDDIVKAGIIPVKVIHEEDLKKNEYE